MLFKIIAYFSIVFGSIFTLGAIYIYFTIEEPFDILIGWVFLGPLPLAVGIYILKYMKSKVNLTVLNKMKFKK